jgi:hypothetical protein
MLVRKIRIMKMSQIRKREMTRLSLKMLMMGQLKKRTPTMNKQIKTSRLMSNASPRVRL